jgi:hypothetical protein
MTAEADEQDRIHSQQVNLLSQYLTEILMSVASTPGSALSWNDVAFACTLAMRGLTYAVARGSGRDGVKLETELRAAIAAGLKQPLDLKCFSDEPAMQAWKAANRPDQPPPSGERH